MASPRVTRTDLLAGHEFWHALKALGVATEVVICPGEGHAIAKPEHQRDIEQRPPAWFDRYLMR